MVLLSKINGMAIVAAMALSSTQASPTPKNGPATKRDPPQKLPACSTYGDHKWQPAMDFDRDSCYNTPAIGVNGDLSPGLNNCYTKGPTDCRDESDLDNNNVYVRARCNNGWCAHIYAYFFEKDTNLENVCGVGAGHRYDWEHVVVWVNNDVAKYVAVSEHGKYEVKRIEDVLLDQGTHPKVVYHRAGAQTHSFRFAKKSDDAIENHKGRWFYGDLVSFMGFPSTEIRDSMLNHNWGPATIDFRDDQMVRALTSAMGHFKIPLDTNFDEPTAPGIPDCALSAGVRIESK